jgi:hypothetical protein
MFLRGCLAVLPGIDVKPGKTIQLPCRVEAHWFTGIEAVPRMEITVLEVCRFCAFFIQIIGNFQIRVITECHMDTLRMGVSFLIFILFVLTSPVILIESFFIQPPRVSQLCVSPHILLRENTRVF